MINSIELKDNYWNYLRRRVPLIIKSLLLTFIIGAGLWLLLDSIQSRRIENLFNAQLSERLKRQAQEDRIQFDNYVRVHYQTAKLTVSQKRFNDYIVRQGWSIEKTDRIKHYKEIPPWLPKPSVLRTFVHPYYALLLDKTGNVREIYNVWTDPLPKSLSKPSTLLRKLSHNQSLMTDINGIPFLITSASEIDKQGNLLAILMIASPLNEDFLISSQDSTTENIVALLIGEEPRVLSSNRPDLLPEGTMLNTLKNQYITTGVSFFDYGSSDLLLQFASFISKERFALLNESILSTERSHRALIALVLIASFSLIMYGIILRVKRIVKGVQAFSSQNLKIQSLEIKKGDELFVLEEQLNHMKMEIIDSQEMIRKKIKELEKTNSLLNLEVTNRKTVEEELRKHREHLEALVKERTSDLMKANKQLKEEIYVRKIGEEKLLRHNEYFNNVIESLTHPFSVIDVNDYSIKMANSATYEGPLPEDLKCYSLSHKQSKPCESHECICPIEEVKRTNRPVKVEHIHYDEDGHPRNVEIYITPMFDENGDVFQVIEYILDITDRKKAEEELQKSHAQLIQSEKMSAVGTMVAGVAHELINPMMSIVNFIEYCLKKTSTDDERYNILQNTERESNRCINIVENLLTFSHMEKEGEEEFQYDSCAMIIDRVLNLLSYRFEKERVQLTKHYTKVIPDILMRINSIQQVFLNIIMNALDALKEREKKEISIDLHRKDGYVNITIADSGPGIAPGNLQRIFDPFFTTKPTGHGTGLGLSISQSIIDMHKGKIICNSKPDQGSRFGISLPIESFNKSEYRNTKY